MEQLKRESYKLSSWLVDGGLDLISCCSRLSPITQQPQQTRIGSGNRRQQLSSSFKKRYSSIDVATNSLTDKNNIVIHGAGLSKPSSNLVGEHPGSAGAVVSSSFDKSNQTSAINNSNSMNHAAAGGSGGGNSSSTVAAAISSHHSNQYSSMSTSSNTSTNMPTGAQISRSNNNSSQFYHHLLPPNDESTFENEFNEYPISNMMIENGGAASGENNTIDEINLLNLHNSALSNTSKFYNHGAFHGSGGHYGFYHHHHHHGNHLNSHSNTQQLPPIEKSLVLKVINPLLPSSRFIDSVQILTLSLLIQPFSADENKQRHQLESQADKRED